MLKTKRLTLRAPCEDDLEAMFAVYSNPNAMKYWSTPPHEDISVTKKLLDGRIAHWAHAPVNFQIELDGSFIGNAGNYYKNELGAMLEPDHWRKGYVREAFEAIIPHLWSVTDHDVLTGDIDPNNAASLALVNSLGFHETHRAQNTFCIDGVWVDSIYFALPRPPKSP